MCGAFSDGLRPPARGDTSVEAEPCLVVALHGCCVNGLDVEEQEVTAPHLAGNGPATCGS